MSFERALIVRGIPANVTADDVKLFFSSDCPSGGPIEEVQLAASEGKATVTFEHAHGNYSIYTEFDYIPLLGDKK